SHRADADRKPVERGVVLPAGRAEATLAANRVGQIAFLPFDSFIPRNHHLRDAVAWQNAERVSPQSLPNHPELAAISRIDRRRTIRQRDGMLQRKPAPGPDLRLIAGR